MSDWKNVQYKDGKMRTSEGGGGGGSSTFAGLDDVGFSNLSNGQVPKYNSTTQKWENAEESGGGSGWELIAENTTTTTWSQSPEENVFFLVYWNAYELWNIFVGKDGSLHNQKIVNEGNIGTSPTFSYSNGTVTATWGSANYAKIFRGTGSSSENSAIDITSDFTFSSPFSYQAGGAYIQGDLLVVNIIVHATASASSSASVFSIDLHGRTLQTYQYLTLNDRGAMRTIMVSPQGAATIDANDSFSKNTDYPLLSGVLVLN